MNQTESTRVIILVHGTWAKNAPWTEGTSDLGKFLSEDLPGKTILKRFNWSGRNSFAARANAGAELLTFIEKSRQENACPHFIISHSHGGNVALRTLHYGKLWEGIAGLACFSTPFLHVRKRTIPKPAPDTSVFPVIFGLWVILPLFAQGKPLLALVAGMATMFIAFQTFHFMRSVAKFLVDPINVPETFRKKMLIVRVTGDEASGALISSQFATWLMTKAWKIPSALMTGLARRTEDFTKTNGCLQLVVVFSSLALGFWALGHYAGSKNAYVAWLGLGVFMISLLVWQTKRGFYIVISYVLAANWIALAFILSLLVLPFGLEIVFTALLVEVAVEVTPIGSFFVWLFGPDESINSLVHSQPYQDPRVFALVKDWVSECSEDFSGPTVGPENPL